jgi:rubrerythrin
MEISELISGIMNEEFADISLYRAEAELFAAKIVNGKRIAQTFQAFAEEEAEHARALMRLAGGNRDIKPRKIAAGSSLRGCLEVHKRREAMSVNFYRQLILQTTVTEHKLMLKGILSQESEHLREIMKYLGALTGADN